jgi:hypothetical protein
VTPAEHWAEAERLLASVEAGRIAWLDGDLFLQDVHNETLLRAAVHAGLAAVAPDRWKAATRDGQQCGECRRFQPADQIIRQPPPDGATVCADCRTTQLPGGTP